MIVTWRETHTHQNLLRTCFLPTTIEVDTIREVEAPVGCFDDCVQVVGPGGGRIARAVLTKLIGCIRCSLTRNPVQSTHRAVLPDEPISVEAVERTGIRAGEIALLMVGYSPPTGDDELPAYPYLSKEAAEYLATLSVKAFATDAFAVESVARMYEAIDAGATGYEGVAPLHQVFLGREIPVFEQLENLEELIGLERLVFVGFPLKVEGSNGSPIRAAALVY